MKPKKTKPTEQPQVPATSSTSAAPAVPDSPPEVDLKAEAQKAAAIAVEEKPKSKPTVEEVEAGRDQFMASFGFAEPRETDPDKVATQEPEEPNPEEKEEPEDPHKKEEPEAKPGETETEVEEQEEEEEEEDEAATIQRVAEETAKAISSRIEPTKPAPTPETKPVSGPQVNQARELRLAVLKEVESLSPQMAGLADREKAFLDAEAVYVAEWKKSNPGQRFDDTAAEHDEFYARRPQFPRELYDAAIVIVAEKRGEERAKAHIAREMEQTSFKTEFKDAVPVALKATEAELTTAASELGKTLGFEVKATDLNAAISELGNEDPLAAKIFAQEGEKFHILATEAQFFERFGSKHEFKPNFTVKLRSTGETFHPHLVLNEFEIALEERLAKRPAKETERDGKRFIRVQTMHDRVKKILESKELSDQQKDSAIRDLGAKHWTLDAKTTIEAMRSTMVDSAAKRTKEIRELTGATKQPAKRASNGGATATPPARRSVASPSDSVKTDTTGKSSADKLNRDAAIDAAMW